MLSHRLVRPLLLSLGLVCLASSSVAPTLSVDGGSGYCADLFIQQCKDRVRDERKEWLDMILNANFDKEDEIKRDYEAARQFLAIEEGVDPIEQTNMRLIDGEKSKEEIEEMIKRECDDFACLAKYYEPLYTFFTVYAKHYEENNDGPKGKRAVAALEYMNRFKTSEDKEGFAARIHMVATSADRARKYGKLKPSMFYNILLQRSYVHKYRMESLEPSSGITFAAIKKIVEEVPKKIEEELQKTAAGEPQTDLLGLSYIDILKEEWSKMKALGVRSLVVSSIIQAPEDDNVEAALAFYKEEYKKGRDLWNRFGSKTATILAHLSALHAINENYPGDILDLVSADLDFDNTRFMREIKKEDRLVLPESFLVESVYRTNDKNMGILAFRLAKIMLERAFQSGQDLVKHMQDGIKNCTTAQFRMTYRKMYEKNHATSKERDDIYFMEAVQAALRTINKNSYEKEIVTDFYKRLADEYCHDSKNGAYLVNGAARFFKPFTDAFECKDGDNLHYVESNCLPLGSSNLHRRSPNLPAAQKRGHFKSDTSNRAMSLIEKLPREITWKLVEYVPESAFMFRLASRAMKSCVDDYSMLRASTQMVEKVIFTGEQNASNVGDAQLKISISVFPGDATIFLLRLIRHPPPKLIAETLESVKGVEFNEYSVNVNTSDVLVTGYLNECLGIRIGMVTINECGDPRKLAAISRTLERKGFAKIKLSERMLSDCSVHFLKTAINCHNIEMVSLHVHEISNTSNPANILRDLSSMIGTLYIKQNAVNSIAKKKSYFFGLEGFDWAPIILEMFSRKLDKLFINNPSYTEFLPQQSSKMLIERLSLLANEKIWFSASSKHNTQDRTFKHNEYYVHVHEEFGFCLSLKVKHSSRECEPVGDF